MGRSLGRGAVRRVVGGCGASWGGFVGSWGAHGGAVVPEWLLVSRWCQEDILGTK